MHTLTEAFLLLAGATMLAIIGITSVIFSMRSDLIKKLKDVFQMQDNRILLLEREIQSLRTLNKMTQIRHDLLSKRVNRSSDLGQRDLS
jgi:hypothetical protein